MSGQMAEDVAAEVAGHADERKAGGPAGDPPQRIVRRYQRYEKNECQPHAGCMGRPGGQAVDQIFHAILRTY
jgi:hypothetical protein